MLAGPIPPSRTTTITYTYDSLYRLTAADYDDGSFYHYTYDATGNRLTQETELLTNNYVYDSANRLTSVDGQAYTYDNNGNLLNDGVSAYTYNHANRLTAVSGQPSAYSFAYNGLGDRLQQTVDAVTTNYTLDLNAGLTQVLSDGTSTYLYGLGRIGEYSTAWNYYLTDALGSVRQLTDSTGSIALAQSYAPYGDLTESAGETTSNYGFAGEWTDSTGLQHLRARYLNTGIGRFISRDTWAGDYNKPMSLNRWMYVEGNPVMYTDSNGNMPCMSQGGDCISNEHESGVIITEDGVEPDVFSITGGDVQLASCGWAINIINVAVGSEEINNTGTHVSQLKSKYSGRELMVLEMYDLYVKTPGPWHTGNNFSFTHFFGLMLLYESGGNQFYIDINKEVIGHQLYSKVGTGADARGGYCLKETFGCFDGAIRFLARYSQAWWDQYKNSFYSGEYDPAKKRNPPILVNGGPPGGRSELYSKAFSYGFQFLYPQGDNWEDWSHYDPQEAFDSGQRYPKDKSKTYCAQQIRETTEWLTYKASHPEAKHPFIFHEGDTYVLTAEQNVWYGKYCKQYP